VPRDTNGVGRPVTADRRGLGTHEPIEIAAHRVGKCADPGGVALQRVVRRAHRIPILKEKALDIRILLVLTFSL
jgi:hypothetical protein